MTHAPASAPRPAHFVSAARVKAGTLWLLVASSSIVLIEPAPYDAVFVVAFGLFALAGLPVSYRTMPLLILVTLFNIGGAFALVPFLDQQPSVMFVMVSFYLGFSAFFFANVVTEHTQQRIEIIRSAWVFAGLIAAVSGLIGYFGIAGTGELFTRYGRATGTFKDPNVFGPFLAVPVVMIVQGFMSGSLKRPFVSLLVLFILLGGIFLSFSRGAWGVTVLASMLTGALLFLTTRSALTRARIVAIAVLGVVLLALALAAALSVESIGQVFEMRAQLVQDYDSGVRGRFGKIIEAVPLLLERPNGIGPLRFSDFFPEAPHNVFINAFSSYGWLGGLSYLVLVLLTIRLGWRTVWRQTPWQGPYIALWSVTFCQLLQGLQIDTDHWRHLWLLIGLTWGFAAAVAPTAPGRWPAPAGARPAGAGAGSPLASAGR